MTKFSPFALGSLLLLPNLIAQAQNVPPGDAPQVPPGTLQTTLPVKPLVPRTDDQAPAGREIAEKAPLARAILDGWLAKDPQRADRYVRVVYWTPADREPAPQYRERLSKILLDIQNFYAFEMNRNGFGQRTFKLEKEDDGLLKMYLAHGSKPRAAYDVGEDPGTEIRKDCFEVLKQAGIDGDKETVLIFNNLVNWDATTRTMDGKSPYYGGGTTRHGTAWQVDSPVLSLENVLDVADADKVHHNQYGFVTLGHYNSMFIGGIAHELGHALSMPHNIERPDQAGWGKSLMGSGNRTYGEELRDDTKSESKGRGSFLPFADALRLASHPSFCGSVKGFDLEPDATLTDVKLSTQANKLVYSARVIADPPVYGVVGYFDPAGGKDYDSRTATAIPDKNGRFTLESDALVAGKGGELRVVTFQANGAASSSASGGTNPWRYPYSVKADGSPDLTEWNTTQQLMPLSFAVVAQDAKATAAALQALQQQNAPANVLEIARVQVANFANTPKPVPTEATGQTLYLSEAKPSLETVGWLQPTYNRLPIEDGSGGPLLGAGGQFYARGIYAHGPAHHVYNLGGQWKRFGGTVGVAQGKDGSVDFTIIGDGKQLWKSPIIKDDALATFDVPVEGVKTLELLVDNGNDGASSDWGLWLDPKLTR